MEKLLNYFVPEKYVLDLDIDKNKKTISGRVGVVGKALSRTIKFHAVDLEITEVIIHGKYADFSCNDNILEIDLDNNSADQNISIQIYYNGTLNENMEGAYLSSYEYQGKKEIIVATQFESHYAREAFPCIDEPAAKAVFHLMLSTPEEDEDIVLSNTPIIKTEEKAGRIKRSFYGTPRMSTYLLAWVIGKFHGKTIKNKHGVEITTYCALNQDLNSVDYANNIAAKSLEFYDDNFGLPYPLDKLDQVALPDFEAGAMENWGLVTYRESMLLASKSATLGTRKGVALTVAHELSHQWFGDLVTMAWWDDLWLNESFASVMEYYAVDYIHPEYKIFQGFFTRDAYSALLRDAYSDVQAVHQDVKDPAEIATLFDSAIVYSKGARLMLMLIRAMGWDNFCKGIKDYFKKHQYKNTVGDDLWEALRPYADFDPKELIHAFIDKPGYPVITSDNDFKDYTEKRFLLDGKMTSANWPLPKITEDMSGHYILNLNDAQFSQRLENFDKLSLEEKLRLLIDRSLTTKTDLASVASTVPLIQKFQHEDNASVWNIVASLISGLKIFFDDDSEEEKVLKNFVRNLITPKLNEIGLTTGKNDDENLIRLRANLLAFNYYAEDKTNLEKLAKMYDSDFKKLDPEIRSDILSAKAYINPEIINDYIKAYQETADPDIKFDLLIAITETKDKTQLKTVKKLLGNLDIVKPQDQLYLFVYLYRNPKAKTDVFDWLTKNWDFVKSIGGDKSISDYPMLIARLARTKEEYQKFQAFFGPKKTDPALSRAIKIGENEIKTRLELIKKDQKNVFESLGVRLTTDYRRL